MKIETKIKLLGLMEFIIYSPTLLITFLLLIELASSGKWSMFNSSFYGLLLISSLYSIARLLTGVGLVLLKKWSFKLVVFFAFVTILVLTPIGVINNLFSGSVTFKDISKIVVYFVYNLGILVYFNTKKFKIFFQKK